ncbi:MAG: sensor histidine kinase [Pseudomonadota bacterium]
MHITQSPRNVQADVFEDKGSSPSETGSQGSVKLMDFQELERKRISRELHDGLGQLLTSIKLRVQQCVSELENSGKSEVLGDAWDSMEQIPTLVTEAIQEVRSICSALRPAMLDDLGVLAAITWQCRQCRETMPRLKTEVDFFLEESEIPEALKTNLYRIVQEALNNALKYSGADVIRVNMRKEQGTLYLSIEDNGRGFTHDDTGAKFTSTGIGGFGLTSMRERAESLGGTLIIESNLNIGTNVQVALPLDGSKFRN